MSIHEHFVGYFAIRGSSWVSVIETKQTNCGLFKQQTFVQCGFLVNCFSGMAVLNKVALQFKERFWPLDICGFNRVPMQQVGVGWPSNFGISGTVPSVQWRQRGLKKE